MYSKFLIFFNAFKSRADLNINPQPFINFKHSSGSIRDVFVSNIILNAVITP